MCRAFDLTRVAQLVLLAESVELWFDSTHLRAKIWKTRVTRTILYFDSMTLFENFLAHMHFLSSKIVKEIPFHRKVQFFLLFSPKHSFFNHFKNLLLTKKAHLILTQTIYNWLDWLESQIKSQKYSTWLDNQWLEWLMTLTISDSTQPFCSILTFFKYSHLYASDQTFHLPHRQF